MNVDWTFEDRDLANHFGAHVREQLPWYEIATDAVACVARQYVSREGTVYDLGAATGNVGNALRPLLAQRDAVLVAVEPSKEMAEHYEGPGRVINKPMEDVEPLPYDLAVAFLTFMFVRPSVVWDEVDRWRSFAKPSGALVVVERTTPPGGYPSLVLSRLTLDAKHRAGASPRQIIDKELSLSGIQRPLDPQQLANRGAVEFFRFADFGGYIIEAAP
jgi:tRNA (cmo5U34)-methyltransferase